MCSEMIGAGFEVIDVPVERLSEPLRGEGEALALQTFECVNQSPFTYLVIVSESSSSLKGLVR
jgi:hypothetical protein